VESLVLYKNKLAEALRVRRDIRGRISLYAMVIIMVVIIVVIMVRKI
jgi:hypothetical protein